MIKIKKSATADTRTCDWSKVTEDELIRASRSHKSDVLLGIWFFSDKLSEAGLNHDWSKVSLDGSAAFHKDFKSGFKTQDWFKMHQREERHHLKDPQYVQDDVNLIDILEMITDGVMAGLARSGEYRKEEIPDSLLRKAFDNTIELLLKNVEVEECPACPEFKENN